VVRRPDGDGVVSAGAGRAWKAAAVAGLLLCSGHSAFALNPALDVSQYAHYAWRNREGFAQGGINAIAQTPDGYLWLGTEFGLLRFDGVKAVSWQPPRDQSLPSSWIISLLTARDGTLWIGTSRGLAMWRNRTLTRYPQLDGQYIFRLLEDRAGSVWAGTMGVPAGKLCEIAKGNVRCDGREGQLGLGVVGLHEDARGRLWAGVNEGLWRWTPDPAEFHSMPGEGDKVQAFADGDNGALLIGTGHGIRRLIDGKTEPYPLPGVERATYITQMLRDREGSLWIGTSEGGLLHVHGGRIDQFTRADGLSGNLVITLFQDREGSIWAGTRDGLDRFRDIAVATFGTDQGLSGATAMSVLGAPNGNVWFGTSGGLDRWINGSIDEPRIGGQQRGQLNGRKPASLFQDGRGRLWISTLDGVGYLENDRFISLNGVPGGPVHDIAQDTQGSVWIANQNHGLIRVSPDLVIQQFSWATLGREDFAYALAADRVHGGLWLGFFNGGLAYFNEGRVQTSYAAANGLGGGRVSSLQVQPDGTLWAATAGGLSILKGGRVVTLTSKNGLPCDAVHWAMKEDAHSIWLYMPCGLIRIRDSDLEAWAANADNDGDPTRSVQTMLLDATDGVPLRAERGGYTPQVTKAADGRFWFIGPVGISVFDPRHMPFNRLPPPVHIERISADRQDRDAGARRFELPALTRDLEIDYTALSLVAPEKNHFRYRLEGRDPEWVDAGNRRQAFYQNLAPGPYRFRVIASNNSGVWNETGDVLEFSIASAWYQRTSVRTAAVVGLCALLWAMYRYRVRQIAHVYDTRVQARVDERTRIARDLHDTLLQSFHGLLFRFQAVANKFPDSQLKQEFEQTIDQAVQAVAEGRNAVQNLRESTVVTNDLAEALGTLGKELATDRADEPDRRPPVFDVTVEGTPRNLHPVVRDDIYRIAGEALRNAFRHSRARRIEVQIHYDDRQLRVAVRDDGKGIDPARLDEDRPGHFGLRGMRERAGVIGGSLEVWSEAHLGTEVALTVPAAAAYAGPRARGWFRWFAGRTGTES